MQILLLKTNWRSSTCFSRYLLLRLVISTADSLSVAAYGAFRNWVTKYEFYALGVEPLILQCGSKLLTLEHNALIWAEGYFSAG